MPSPVTAPPLQLLGWHTCRALAAASESAAAPPPAPSLTAKTKEGATGEGCCCGAPPCWPAAPSAAVTRSADSSSTPRARARRVPVPAARLRARARRTPGAAALLEARPPMTVAMAVTVASPPASRPVARIVFLIQIAVQQTDATNGEGARSPPAWRPRPLATLAPSARAAPRSPARGRPARWSTVAARRHSPTDLQPAGEREALRAAPRARRSAPRAPLARRGLPAPSLPPPLAHARAAAPAVPAPSPPAAPARGAAGALWRTRARARNGPPFRIPAC